MIELATHEVVARRELLARLVRDALAAAGLPIVSPNMSRELVHGGAEVRVDELADCHAPVRIEWRTNNVLMNAAITAGVGTPTFDHYTMVLEGMLRIMKEILSSEGFETRDCTNDFAPFTIEVLGRQDGTTAWTTAGHINSLGFPGATR